MNVPKYVFIIPYRNRLEHKTFFDYYMRNKVLKNYEPESYFLLYVHQKDSRQFNRGAMKNIGFLYIKKTYPNDYHNIILIFNDVDTVPFKEDLLDYDVEENEIKHFYGYKFALGGILSINAKTFEKLNGFPNYWSWGYEDNILQKRALLNDVSINRDQFYDITSHSILHFSDGYEKFVSYRNYLSINNKTFNEIDGLDKIKNVSFHFNTNDNMLDVMHFTTYYNYDDDKYFVHKKHYGIKARVPKQRNNFMKLFN